MSNLKKVLVNNDGLEITFFVDDGVARVEFRSNGRFDLSSTADVVLVVNGSPIVVQPQSEVFAVAPIGNWERFADGPISIMTRVDEFFEGWEFDPA